MHEIGDPPAKQTGSSASGTGDSELRRVLSLPLLVLYGLGVTVGAGIYVLIGAAVERAGMYAPLSFVLAAFAMAFSAGSFAELSVRFPVSAGEAAYVRNGFNSRTLGLMTGLLVVVSALISSAAIAIGSAGYIEQFFAVPQTIIVVVVLLILGCVAAWGIMESVAMAGFITILEVGGLLFIIAAGFILQPEIVWRVDEVVPRHWDKAVVTSLVSTGLLAFFAFIGFEDLVNLAEEARDPRRDMPLAILLTLIGATTIYVLVVYVAEMTVPVGELAASRAPLALVFERVTGMSPVVITAIAVFATLNGVIVQVIMASRVLYGLARQGSLPARLGRVHPVTRTPLYATVLVVALVLLLALFFPIEQLAEMTSRVVLVIFSLVNAALLKLKLSPNAPPAAGFTVPVWVPLFGLIVSILFLIGDNLGALL